MATSSRRITIPHPDLTNSQKTYLSADYTTGTNISVLSNEGFAANQIAVIGNPREELTEEKSISGLSQTGVIQLSGALNFDHSSNTPIFRSEYNQVEISTNDGSGWSVLITTDIQWDQLNTVYVHSGGTSSHSYRFRFYNSASTDFSEYSGTITGAGYDKNQIGYLAQEVRKTVGDINRQIVSDSEILRMFTAAKDIIRAKAPKGGWYFWKNYSEGTLLALASTSKYDLDDISGRIDFIAQIRYRYNNDTTDEIYPIDPKTDLEFYDLIRDNNREADDWVEAYRILPSDGVSTSGYIQVYPTPENSSIGSFYVDWYENEADYDSFTDTTKIPMPQMLADYAISKIEAMKGNDGKSKVYRDLFFGPPSDQRDNDDLSGIALLYSVHDKKLRALKKPQVLKKFMGRRFLSRYYGGKSSSRSLSDRENFW